MGLHGVMADGQMDKVFTLWPSLNSLSGALIKNIFHVSCASTDDKLQNVCLQETN